MSTVSAAESKQYLKSTYTEIIKAIIPDLEDAYYSLPLEQVRVDSIDLLTMRTELERVLGREIPDADWLNLRTLDDIAAYCVRLSGPQHMRHQRRAGNTVGKEDCIIVNMPQMAIEALSESWLFKELGQRHWDMLCKGLGTNSGDIADEEGNRLYATFVRVKISSSSSLASFRENDVLAAGQSMERYGNGMYLSTINLSSVADSVTGNLITSFSMRNSGDNTKLTKSQPYTAENNITAVTLLPEFANEYRNVKKQVLDQILIGQELFPMAGNIMHETEYNINPYHDLNGVGLLYFAAYPIICDTCEADYFNRNYQDTKRWELKWSTRDRDVFYYGNCNIEETIVYRLHWVEFNEDIVKTYSTLSRKKDGFRMADLFTVKSARK